MVWYQATSHVYGFHPDTNTTQAWSLAEIVNIDALDETRCLDTSFAGSLIEIDILTHNFLVARCSFMLSTDKTRIIHKSHDRAAYSA